MSLVDTGCAAQRLSSGEPLLGTAPERAASWLLLEHPGPWPADGWPPDLAPAVVSVLDAATALSVRPQLVRRVQRQRRDRWTIMAASCRAGARWLETREVSDLREIAELDLDALAQGRRPSFGSDTVRPTVLVCAHGKRDVCCARRGRPVAHALDAQLPGHVWETTHVGGDRFAANVVTLPHGSYHGAVVPQLAAALALAATNGTVVLEHLRGFAGTPAATQAAEIFVRRMLSLHGLDAVLATGHEAGMGATHRVEVLLARRGRRFRVDLRSQQQTHQRLTSCAGGGIHDRPYVWELLGMVELDPSMNSGVDG